MIIIFFGLIAEFGISDSPEAYLVIVIGGAGFGFIRTGDTDGVLTIEGGATMICSNPLIESNSSSIELCRGSLYITNLNFSFALTFCDDYPRILVNVI